MTCAIVIDMYWHPHVIVGLLILHILQAAYVHGKPIPSLMADRKWVRIIPSRFMVLGWKPHWSTISFCAQWTETFNVSWGLLSFSLFLWLSTYLPAYLLCIYLSIDLSISLFLSFSLSVFLSFISLPIYLSTYLPIYLCTYLPIYLSIYLSLSLSLSSVYLSTCLSVVQCHSV